MKRMGITILAGLLLAAGCGGNGADSLQAEPQFRLSYGTTPQEARFMRSGGDLLLEFSPDANGAFVELQPGFDPAYFSEAWENDSDTVHIVVPVDDRLQLGVVPTPQYRGETVTLRISRSAAQRSTSKPPLGNLNSVQDLSATDLGNGMVRLEWTQLNWGDYDNNGEVNVADITPLGINFGKSGPWQPTEIPYWVDGDRNGLISLADITPIGQYYGNGVKGYNIYRTDGTAPPASGLLDFAASASASQTPGLPRHFSVDVSCPPDGTFVVRPVDFQDIEGVNSVAAVLSGAPSLEVNLDIVGQQLYDQNTGLPGGFGNDSVILRIIDNIKEVNAVEYGTVTPLATGQFSVSGLPQGKALFLQIAYVPTVDLASGGAKGPSRVPAGILRRVSEIPAGADVTTVPLRIPAGDDPVVLTTAIDLGTANPDGGFFVKLDDQQDIPGDNPATLPIENGYTVQHELQLDYLNSLLSGDTDGVNGFDKEPQLRDSDRDCLSAKREEQVLDDDDAYENRPEIEIEGIVTGIDTQNGLLFLTNAVLEVGSTEKPLPNDVVVYYTEFTPFEFRDKTVDPELIGQLDPLDILAGDLLKIDLYSLEDTGDVLPTKYWVEHVRKEIKD